MHSITLKIDVDTLRGTQEGVPRLAALLRRQDIPATFLFSLGPDHTGRALRRVFRRGFLDKVRRTSVTSHYGLNTLLYGTLLPGPDIGRRCRGEMRAVADQGFEVGVHAWDHVKWQDGVAQASYSWTFEQLARAVARFEKIFGFPPSVHGAAGWQMNEHVPLLERQFGFEFASDTRGRSPFLPAGGGVVQLPTTLPTLDELIGVDGASIEDAVQKLADSVRAEPGRDQVFTLHAELEGGAYLPQFGALLVAWREAGFAFRTLGDLARAVDIATVPACRIDARMLAGRSGTLSIQAPPERPAAYI